MAFQQTRIKKYFHTEENSSDENNANDSEKEFYLGTQSESQDSYWSTNLLTFGDIRVSEVRISSYSQNRITNFLAAFMKRKVPSSSEGFILDPKDRISRSLNQRSLDSCYSKQEISNLALKVLKIYVEYLHKKNEHLHKASN